GPDAALVHRYDRRMLEARGDPRLAGEAAPQTVAAGQELLDRDEATEPPVARGDDPAHAAAGDLALTLVELGIDGRKLAGRAALRRRLRGQRRVDGRARHRRRGDVLRRDRLVMLQAPRRHRLMVAEALERRQCDT